MSAFYLALTELPGSTEEQVRIEFAFVHMKIILSVFKCRKICQDFQGRKLCLHVLFSACAYLAENMKQFYANIFHEILLSETHIYFSFHVLLQPILRMKAISREK